MFAQTKWLERTWSFTFPVGLAAGILERLRGTPARLEELIRGVPSTVLVRRAGRAWSLQEHAGHLLELEAILVARIEEHLAASASLSAADMSNAATWEAEYNLRPLGEILTAFRRSRAALARRLEPLAAKDFERACRHPRLGVAMRLVDTCWFFAEHDDHHLAQMRHLISP